MLAQRQVAPSGRAVAARRQAFAPAVRPASGRRSVAVAAARHEWPDPEFIKETLAAFPEQGIADVEEARALFSNGGYTYLDVRTNLEFEEVGHVKGSVNIPFYTAKKVYNAETRQRSIVKEENKNFIAQVKKRFPKDDAKILIGCSDGRTYSRMALEALDEAGYVNLAGLRGGYNAWFRVFDNKLNRRRFGEYAENYQHNGDSGGIHASGAGFARVDAIERYVPPSY